MPSLMPERYALDITGISTNNLVAAEPHLLVKRKSRAIAPTYAPYFKKSLEIIDDLTGVKLDATQYRCLDIIPLPSAIAGIGNEVYSIIIIIDESVSDNVSLNYQTIGGEYVRSFETTKNLLEALTSDTRPSAWPNIINRPDSFEPSLHLHAVGDAIGWEYVAVALEQLKNTILLGDSIGHEEILTYIDEQSTVLLGVINGSGASSLGAHAGDFQNPHRVTKTQVGLTDIQNYPVATLSDIQNPEANKYRYITNDVLKSYLDSFFTAYGIALAAEVLYVKTAADEALLIAKSNNDNVLNSEILARELLQKYADAQALLPKTVDYALPTNVNWSGIAFGNGAFVAVSYASDLAAVSTDGIAWSMSTLPSVAKWTSIAFGNDVFVAIADENAIVATSTDGIDWEMQLLPIKNDWRFVGYYNGKFTAMAIDSQISATSADGIIWARDNIDTFFVSELLSVGSLDPITTKLLNSGSLTVPKTVTSISITGRGGAGTDYVAGSSGQPYIAPTSQTYKWKNVANYNTWGYVRYETYLAVLVEVYPTTAEFVASPYSPYLDPAPTPTYNGQVWISNTYKTVASAGAGEEGSAWYRVYTAEIDQAGSPGQPYIAPGPGQAATIGASATVTVAGVNYTFPGNYGSSTPPITTQVAIVNPALASNVNYSCPTGTLASISYIIPPVPTATSFINTGSLTIPKGTASIDITGRGAAGNDYVAGSPGQPYVAPTEPTYTYTTTANNHGTGNVGLTADGPNYPTATPCYDTAGSTGAANITYSTWETNPGVSMWFTSWDCPVTTATMTSPGSPGQPYIAPTAGTAATTGASATVTVAGVTYTFPGGTGSATPPVTTKTVALNTSTATAVTYNCPSGSSVNGLYSAPSNATSTLTTAVTLGSIAFGNNKSAAVSLSNLVADSSDAITFQQRVMPNTAAKWKSVAYGNGVFMAIASNSAQAATSTDGITWTQIAMSANLDWQSVAYGNGVFVAVANNSKTSVSIGARLVTAGTAPPVPTYRLVPNATDVVEGSTINFTLTTTNVANGTVLYYAIAGVGISASDFVDNALSGSVTINNNTANFAKVIATDATVEGSESFTTTVRATSINGVVLATAPSITIAAS